ncbi:MAG: hypothetical protein NC231_03540 [Bacillus sp. (in: Bacteria)]|nr:hypothetical protein [Bacillus sp. (in: firmicutes)]MCM1426086.1 hypothetical protein [Eubacterium sp.]
MYINDLGAERTASHVHENTAVKTAGAKQSTSSAAATSYPDAMQKALDKQSVTPLNYSSTWAGNIIIREALEKMKEDPEWEESVMSKIKEETRTDYQLDGQSGLQSYLMQQLINGGSNASLLNYGYSPYTASLSGYTGLGMLASSAYGNVMNNAYNTSLLGNWLL